MSASNRLKQLEQRPQPQHPHRMSQEALTIYMESLTPRQQDSFIKTMTDDDLSASIEHLTALTEQSHANT